MQVEFSELALAAMRRSFPDEGRRISAFSSLKWYLVVRGGDLSEPCPAFEGRQLHLYPFGRLRVLWEQRSETIMVWAVQPLTEIT
jgi:hypothetical protein